VRPRYNHPVMLGGQTFEDQVFGKHYELSLKCDLGPGVQEIIVKELKQAL
jgi:hypothetical protein